MNSSPLQAFHTESWKAVFTGSVLFKIFSKPDLLILVQPICNDLHEMRERIHCPSLHPVGAGEAWWRDYFWGRSWLLHTGHKLLKEPGGHFSSVVMATWFFCPVTSIAPCLWDLAVNWQFHVQRNSTWTVSSLLTEFLWSFVYTVQAQKTSRHCLRFLLLKILLKTKVRTYTKCKNRAFFWLL